MDELRTVNPSPLAVIQAAIRQGVTPETLDKLLDFQLKLEANEARKAFVAALASFKAEAPKLIKNKHVAFNKTEYDHATLDSIVNAVSPKLSESGLSFRWDIANENSQIAVACILTHVAGHSERVQSPFVGRDDSGGKNAVQAVGSAITYLQRYTLLSALGLATEDQDDDARNASAIGEAEAQIAGCEDMAQLQGTFRVLYNQAMTAKNMTLAGAIIRAKDARKAELQAAK